MYILTVGILSILISLIISYVLNLKIQNMHDIFIKFSTIFNSISEIVIQILQYILNKTVKPKLIPKLDFFKWD